MVYLGKELRFLDESSRKGQGRPAIAVGRQHEMEKDMDMRRSADPGCI